MRVRAPAAPSSLPACVQVAKAIADVNRKLAQDGASFYAGLIPCCSAGCARAPVLHRRAASLCEDGKCVLLTRGHPALPVAQFCAASRRRLLLKGLQQLNDAALHASEAGSHDANSCAEGGPRESRRRKRGCPSDEDGMESADDARIELIGR